MNKQEKKKEIDEKHKSIDEKHRQENENQDERAWNHKRTTRQVINQKNTSSIGNDGEA